MTTMHPSELLQGRDESRSAQTAAETRPQRDWLDSLAPYAVFAVVLAVYVRTLCPTIFADDCGEIATAVATGGVMHPPGYPLYTLVGRLFVGAIPIGEPAWRLGLVSAFAGAAAAVACYRLTRVAGARPISAIASAGAFAFSLALWRQSTKVETYSLNALFSALVLLRAYAYSRSGRHRDLYLFTVCVGLALTDHASAACAALGGLWIVGGRLRCDADRFAAAARAAALGFAPLCLYGLLWLWAAHDPGGQVWGDPDSVRRFFLQITAARYRVYMGAQPLSLVAQRDLIDLPAQMWRNLGWFLVGIVPGAAWGFKSAGTRQIHTAMAIALGLYLAEISLYGILNIFEYYTPVILLLSIWAGVGLDTLMDAVPTRGAGPAVSRLANAGVCLAVCVCAIGWHWRVCDRSRATYLRDLAVQTLSSLPPRAVLISVGDNRNFAFWYVQDVLGLRRDVAVVPRSMLDGLATSDGRAEMGWLLTKLQTQHPHLVHAGAILSHCRQSADFAEREGPTWQIAQCGVALGRAVFLTDVLPDDLQPSAGSPPIFSPLGPAFTVEPYGLTTMIVPTNRLATAALQSRLDQAVLRRITIRPMPGALMQDEPDGNIVNSTYSGMLQTAADLAYSAGNFAVALADMRSSVALAPSPAGYDMLGEMYAARHMPQAAVQAFQGALALEPANTLYDAQLNRARAVESRSGGAGNRTVQ